MARRPRLLRASVTVIGASITSKYRWEALAASLDIASSQPIESIGQRRPSATPKNATSVPAVQLAVGDLDDAEEQRRARTRSPGSAMITAQSLEITLALRELGAPQLARPGPGTAG